MTVIMNKIKLLGSIFIFVIFTTEVVPQSVWLEDSFEDFHDGSFLDAGSNCYVSAKGRIQMITRWDFNNDGNLDIFLASSHGHTEKENIFIYLNNGQDIDARSLIELPAAGSYDGLLFDLNKDGYNDLAVANISDSHVKHIPVWIYFGSEKGFLVENRIELPSESGSDIVAGDFNNDSWTDIAVACQYPDNAFETPVSIIYWNSPDGFNAENRLAFSLNGRGAFALTAGDIDNDAIDDLVALTNEKTFFFLSSNNSFKKAENLPSIELGGRAVDLGDYNNDGLKDLLICSKKRVVILIGNGTGKYSMEYSVSLKVSAPHDAVFSDVDQDGLQDVIIANNSNSGGATWTDSYIFYSDGKDFSSRDRLSIPTIAATGVASADLNNDGYPEIVFSNEHVTYQNNIFSYVYWNNKGTFFFENHTQLPTLGALAATIGDANNDGLPDVIFFNDEGYYRDGPSTSFIYFGDGTKNFSATRSKKFLTQQVFGFGHADLDDDNNVEIILANKNFMDGVSHLQAGLNILWGDDGEFKNQTPLTMTYGYGGVRIADINKDGYLDILAAGRCLDLDDPDRHGFPIFWGSKDGFSYKNRQVLHYTIQRLRGQLLMDLNKDGWLDIAAQMNMGTATIWWGSEKGFDDENISTIDLERNDQLMYIKGADLNRDGWIDLICPQRGNPDGTETTSFIYYGSPDGYSNDNRFEVASYVPYQNSIADLNKDGWLDLVLVSYGGEVSGNRPALIYWGSENGFLPGRTELECYGGSGSEILDYDNDGYLDIFISNHRKAGSYLVPKPHEHTTNSMLYWGGPNGFSKDNRWEVEAAGPSGLNLRDAGNSYDRGLYEDYISSVHEIPDGESPAIIEWIADTPFGTTVNFQIRSSDNRENLESAEWFGESGKDSWYKKNGSKINEIEGKYIQYRARLITPNGAASPYLTSVKIYFE